MARYGEKFKQRAVARLLPPESSAISAVSQDMGISVATLERWRADALLIALTLLLKINFAPGKESNAGFESILTFIEVRVEMRGHAASVLRQQGEGVGEAPFHTFTASVGARKFRRTIAPLLNSPYDERLFRRVD